MFLQSKYEKGIQQDARATFGATGFQNFKKPDFKTRHPIVGSTKLSRINFERSEQVFSKEDVPAKASDAKNKMTTLVDPDILGLRKKDWNLSTAVSKNQQEENFERKLTQIKLGFFDTPLPKYRPNTIHAGTDTRDHYTGWNVSTQPVGKNENQRIIDELGKDAMDKTKKHFGKIKDYKTPVETIKTFNETVRQTKRDEKEMRDQIREKYKFENPAATEERINAGVNRIVYENKIKNMRPQSEDHAVNLTFKPNMTRTLKPNIGCYAYHNGNWGTNALSPEVEVWSCCMGEKKTGEGCVKVKVNKDKWILDSCGSAYG